MAIVYVNLGYDKTTNSLPIEEWIQLTIQGLKDHTDLQLEAAATALECSGLGPLEWPSIVYTSFDIPGPGAKITRHRISVDSK